MFSFPPEFPFVSGRKVQAEPQPAPPEAPAAPPELDAPDSELDVTLSEVDAVPPELPFASPEPVTVPRSVLPAAPELPAKAPLPPVFKAAPAPAEVRKPAPPAPAAAPRPERRKIKRDALATSALLRIDGRHAPPSKIELTDITIAGARFRCPHPLEIGEKAQVRLEVGPFRWTTRLRIVHCTRIDDHSVSIGCAFLRTELLRPWPAAA